MVSDANPANANTSARTPWHLWLIGVFFLLWSGLAAFDYLATLFRYEPHLSNFPEETLAYYFAAPLWMYVMWGIGSFGGFVAAIFLLMRNKLTVPVFAAGLLAAVIAQIYSVVNPPPGGLAGMLVPAIVIGVMALMLVYLNWLKRRGVLR